MIKNKFVSGAIIFFFAVFSLAAFAYADITTTITPSQPASFNNYKIFPLEGSDGEWVQIFLQDSQGNNKPYVQINKGDTYDFTYAGFKVQVLDVRADRDGTVTGADIKIISTIDTTPPSNFKFVSPTPSNGALVGARTVSIQFTFDEQNPSAALLQVTSPDGSSANQTASLSSTTASISLSGLADGIYTLAMFANDTAGNWGKDTSTYTFTIDATAPSGFRFISPTLANNSITKNSTQDLAFSFTETNPSTATLQAGFPNGTLSNKTATLLGNTATASFFGIPDGANNFTMFASDLAGNQGTNTSLYRIIVDTTPPSGFRFISPTPNNNSVSKNITLDIMFAFNEPNINTTLLQTGFPNGTLANKTAINNDRNATASLFGLQDGIHNFTMFGIDQASNQASNSSLYKITIDTVTPSNIRFISPTPNNNSITKNSTQDLAFSFTETNPSTASIQIGFPNGTLSNKSIAILTNSVSIPVAGLPDGINNFTIFVADAAGNEASNATLYQLLVDTAQPNNFRFISPTLANNSVIGNSTVDIAFNFNETNPSTASVQAGFPNGTLSNKTATLLGNTATASFFGIPDGANNFTMFASDLAGNQGTNTSLYRIIVDTTPPSGFRFISPTPNNNSVSKNITLDIMFAFNEPNINTTLLQTGFPNGTLANKTAINNDRNATASLFGLQDGIHNFTMFGIDQASNQASNSSAYFITIDTVAPANMRFVSPTLANNSFTKNTTVDIAFSFIDQNPNLAAIQLGFPNGTSQNISMQIAGNTARAPIFGLPEGSINFTMFASDLAGNQASNSSIYKITVDTTPPSNLQFISPPAPNNNTFTKNNSLSLSFSFVEQNPDTQLLRIGFPNGTFENRTNIFLQGLPDGVYNFSIFVNDTAGNIGSNTSLYRIIVDATPSSGFRFIQNTPQNNSFAGSSVNITFAYTELNPAFSILQVAFPNGTVSNLSLNVPSTTNTFTLSGLADGTHNFTMFGIDQASNQASNSSLYTITVDGTAPSALRFASPTLANNSITRNSTLDVGFQFAELNPGSAVLQITFQNGTSINKTASLSGTTASVPLFGIPDGANKLAMFATDLASNQATNTSVYTITVDTQGPSGLRFVSPTPANGTANKNTNLNITFAFTETNPGIASLQIGFPNGSLVNKTGFVSLSDSTASLLLSGLQDGLHNFTMFLNDTVDNQATNTSLYTILIDSAPPANIRFISPTPANNSAATASSINLVFAFADLNPDTAILQIGQPNGITVNKTSAIVNGTANFTLQVSSFGLHNFTMFANDTAGNQASNSTAYFITINQPPQAAIPSSGSPTGGGGGGGSDGTSFITGTVPDSNILVSKFLAPVGQNLFPAEPISFPVPDELSQNGFNNLELAVRELVASSDARMEIRILDKLPGLDDYRESIAVLPSLERPLKFFQVIASPRIRATIFNANFTITLSKQELANSTADKAVVYRFADGKWNNLSIPVRVQKPDGSVQLKISTQNFSVFAVTTKFQSPPSPENQTQANQGNITENATVPASPSPSPSISSAPISGFLTALSPEAYAGIIFVIIIVIIIAIYLWNRKEGEPETQPPQTGEVSTEQAGAGSVEGSSSEKPTDEQYKEEILAGEKLEATDLPEEMPPLPVRQLVKKAKLAKTAKAQKQKVKKKKAQKTAKARKKRPPLKKKAAKK